MMSEGNYIKGVNHAYFMAKYNMTLLQKVLRLKNESPYFHGLIDGFNVFIKARENERQNELKKLRSKDIDRGIEK